MALRKVILDGVEMDMEEFTRTCEIIDRNKVKVIRKISEGVYKTTLHLQD
jgi:hypothetical protein